MEERNMAPEAGASAPGGDCSPAAGGQEEARVLALLKQRDMRGWDIAGALAREGNSPFQGREAMLYPLLHRLESQGRLRSYEFCFEDGRGRRIYSLTRRGRFMKQV